MPAASTRRGPAFASSAPSNRIEPPFASSMPETQRMKVVLPAPFEPIRQATSPRRTSRSAPHSTWISPYPACSPLTLKKASAMGALGAVALSEIGLHHAGIGDDLAG